MTLGKNYLFKVQQIGIERNSPRMTQRYVDDIDMNDSAGWGIGIWLIFDSGGKSGVDGQGIKKQNYENDQKGI